MNGKMMVALVARVLAGHTEVAKVRIEVRGKEASREVTQERGEVVLAALVENGIDPSRLRVAGLGPGPNRVDFVIERRSEPRRSLRAVPATAPDEGAAPAQPPRASGDQGPGGALAAPPTDASPRSESTHPDEEAP